MSDVFVHMTGDEANLLKAIRAVGQGAEKEIAGGFKKGQKEARDLERISKKALRSIETGQDRVNRETREYKRALDAGKITQQQFTSAVKASERAHLKTGNTAGTQLKATIAQYVGVQQVIGGVINLLKEEAAIRDAAAKRVQESRRGIGELAQLAIDEDPEVRKQKFLALKGKAEELFEAGGATDVNAAARAVFSLESAGTLGDFDVFKQLAQSGTVTDIETLARSVATLTTAVGKEETGEAGAVISKGFAASKFTPATVPELLEAAAQSGGIANQLQLSDENLLAATATLAKATGSAGQGGTQVNALLTALAKAPVQIAQAKEQVALAAEKGETVDDATAAIARLPDDFKGQSLQATAEIVKDTIGTEGEAFFKLFGRKEAQGAIFNLTGEAGAEVFPAALAAIEDANRRGDAIALEQAALPTEADTGLAAAQTAEQARNRLQLAEERKFGTLSNLRSELFDTLREESLEKNVVSRGVERLQLNAAEYLSSDRGAIERFLPYVDDAQQREDFERRLEQFDMRETNRLLAEQNQLLQENTRRQPAAMTE